MGKLSNTITLTKKEEIQQGGGNTATPYNWFSLVDSNVELYPALENAATKQIDRANRSITWTFNKEVDVNIPYDYIIRLSRIEAPLGKTYTFSCRLESQLDIWTTSSKIFIQAIDRNWKNTEWDLNYSGETNVNLKDSGQYLLHPSEPNDEHHYRFIDINVNQNVRVKGHVGKKVVLKDIMFYEGTGDLGYIPNPKDVIQNNLDQNPAATIKPTLTRRRVAVNGMECYDGKSGPEGWRENVLDVVVPSNYTNFTLQNLPIFKCIKPYTFKNSNETTQRYLETNLIEYFTSINIKDFDYIDTVVANYISAKSIDTNQIIFKKGQDKWGQIVADPSDNYYMWMGGNSASTAPFSVSKDGSLKCKKVLFTTPTSMTDINQGNFFLLSDNFTYDLESATDTDIKIFMFLKNATLSLSNYEIVNNLNLSNIEFKGYPGKQVVLNKKSSSEITLHNYQDWYLQNTLYLPISTLYSGPIFSMYLDFGNLEYENPSDISIRDSVFQNYYYMNPYKNDIYNWFSNNRTNQTNLFIKGITINNDNTNSPLRIYGNNGERLNITDAYIMSSGLNQSNKTIFVIELSAINFQNISTSIINQVQKYITVDVSIERRNEHDEIEGFPANSKLTNSTIIRDSQGLTYLVILLPFYFNTENKYRKIQYNSPTKSLAPRFNIRFETNYVKLLRE